MIINEPICFIGGALAAVFFFFLNLARLQDWLAKKIDEWRKK